MKQEIKTTHTFEGNNQLSIKKSDITKLDVDCIVNAANRHLQAGGGVCGAIFSAAGYTELQEACDEIGYCEIGNAVITPAFRLPAKSIIHAVGPRWIDGNHNEEASLYSVYRNALNLASKTDCSSVAFPLISAGIFGYPKEDAWKTAIRSVLDYFSEHPEDSFSVIFAVIDNELLSTGEKILNAEIEKRHSAAKNNNDVMPDRNISFDIADIWNSYTAEPISIDSKKPIIHILQQNLDDVFLAFDQAQTPHQVVKALYNLGLAVRNYHDFSFDNYPSLDPFKLDLKECFVWLTYIQRNEYWDGFPTKEYDIKYIALKNRICELIWSKLQPDFQNAIIKTHKERDLRNINGMVRIYHTDRTLISEKALSQESVCEAAGKMTRITFCNGDTIEGFIDCSGLQIYQHPFSAAYEVWNWRKEFFESRKHDYEYNSHTAMEYCIIPYRDIKRVDAIAYTHPRWDVYVNEFQFADSIGKDTQSSSTE